MEANAYLPAHKDGGKNKDAPLSTGDTGASADLKEDENVRVSLFQYKTKDFVLQLA